VAGRIVVNGELFVHGRSLSESDFSSDPQWPAKASLVGEILAAEGLSRAGNLPLEVLKRGGAEDVMRSSIAEGIRLIFSDSESDEDLRKLAASAIAVEPEALLVGSGALAGARAEPLPIATPWSRSAWDSCRTLLVVCGSSNPRSHEQLDELANLAGITAEQFFTGESETAESAERVGRTLLSQAVAAIRFSSRESPSPTLARRIQKEVGVWTRTLFEHASPEALVLMGGETAWTVCREIGGIRLEVGAEFEPGVVVSVLSRKRGNPVLIATKPGGFGQKATLFGILPFGMK
jgi:uncharacterized protein YgbK (DUF1537 family)